MSQSEPLASAPTNQEQLDRWIAELEGKKNPINEAALWGIRMARRLELSNDEFWDMISDIWDKHQEGKPD